MLPMLASLPAAITPGDSKSGPATLLVAPPTSRKHALALLIRVLAPQIGVFVGKFADLEREEEK